jgi:hypothetical protein
MHCVRCWPSRPDVGKRWPSRLVATAAEERLNVRARFALRSLGRGLLGPICCHLRLVARELAFQLSSNSVSDHCVPFPTLGETDVAMLASFSRWRAQQHIEPPSAIGVFETAH